MKKISDTSSRVNTANVLNKYGGTRKWIILSYEIFFFFKEQFIFDLKLTFVSLIYRIIEFPL